MKATLVVAAAVAIATLVQAQDRAATVLTQVRTALGGEQRLAAVKAFSAEGASRRALGTRTVEGTITLLVVRPDKLRRSDESSMFGSSSERVSTFDGTQAWDETVNAARVGGGGGGGDHDHGAGGFAGAFAGPDHNHADGFQGRGSADAAAGGALTPEQVNAARLRRMKMELQRWTVAFLADSNQPFTDGGRAESPDGPADVLETKDEAGRAVRYFSDPANHMPLMVQYQDVRPQGLAAPGAPKISTVAVHLSDYKRVDGVMFPHQIDTSVNGQPSEAWTIEKIKVNPTVKAGVFEKKGK